MNLNAKIFVAGSTGMVGSSIIRRLKKDGYNNIFYKSRKELDLTNQKAVHDFFKNHKFDQLYIAAAKVGGIQANNEYPAEFISENLLIQTNLITTAFNCKIKKILFLGSSCVYPKNSSQPIKESDLLNGKLESTNEAYAIAKIAGIKMCEFYNKQYSKKHKIDYRSIMPCNLYGPGDNYNTKSSHVIPALIHRFHNAKLKKINTIKVWGTGKARREFLYVDDLAQACVYLMSIEKKILKKNINNYNGLINVGSGHDISIMDLANNISKVIGYKGKIQFDKKNFEGVNQKVLDISAMNNLNWKYKTSLNLGLKKSYNNYLKKIIKS